MKGVGRACEERAESYFELLRIGNINPKEAGRFCLDFILANTKNEGSHKTLRIKEIWL